MILRERMLLQLTRCQQALRGNRAHCCRGALGSARVSRVAFGVSPKDAFHPVQLLERYQYPSEVRDCGTQSPTRETRALPGI